MILNKRMPKSFYIIVVLIVFVAVSCSENTLISSKNSNTAFTSHNEQADSLYELALTYTKDSLMYKHAIKLGLEAVELYKKTKNKANVAKTYKQIAKAYDYLEDFEQEKIFLHKSLIIYTEIDNKLEMEKTFNSLGIIYTIWNNIDSAIYYYNKGIELSYITKDTLETIELFQNMGICYRYDGNYEKAIESHVTALQYSENSNYTKGVFDMNLNLAQDYDGLADTTLSFKYLKKASEYVNQTKDPTRQASFYHTYASAFSERNNHKEAYTYYNKTLEISVDANYKRGMAAAYTGLADIAIAENDFVSAEHYADLSIQLEKEINNTKGVIGSLFTLVDINCNKKHFKKALINLKEAESLCGQDGLDDFLPDIYYKYYQTYKQNNQSLLALETFENFYSINDSLTGIEVKEIIADIEIKYQTEKKQQQIKLLNEENKTKKTKANS